MADSLALTTQQNQIVQKTEELFDSYLLDELLQSQKGAARYLELAYLALHDDPEIARQVRSTANDSQNQHLKTHGLVREYQGTALHVVNTMLPLIKRGIMKKKEKLVSKGLDKVLTYVDDMVKKTKATIAEYYNIKTAVNEEISNIVQRNKDNKDRESEILAEKNEKENKIKSGLEELTKVDQSMKKQEKDLRKLQSKRADFIADSVQSYGTIEGLKDLFTTGMAGLSTLFGGAERGKAIFEGLNNAKKVEIDRKEQASKTALEASEATKHDIDEQQKKFEEIEMRRSRMKAEAIEALAAMERLALEKADLMNEESLKQAGLELGKVEKLFGKILFFWEEFSAKLTLLTKSHDGVKVLIECMSEDDDTEDIDEEIGKINKIWNCFGVMCTKYVDESVRQLPDLYAFMSTPADQVAVEECERRKHELLECHRAEIRALGDKVIKR